MSTTIQVKILVYKDGKYAAMDNASGGYPYPTDNIFRAHIWDSLEDMSNYQRMFSELEPFIMTLTLQLNRLEDV